MRNRARLRPFLTLLAAAALVAAHPAAASARDSAAPAHLPDRPALEQGDAPLGVPFASDGFAERIGSGRDGRGDPAPIVLLPASHVGATRGSRPQPVPPTSHFRPPPAPICGYDAAPPTAPPSIRV